MIRRRGHIILVSTAVLVALVVPAYSQAATASPNPSANASVSPLSILESGWTAFGMYQECLANIEAGQDCLASDSDNIRAILKEVRDLSAKIDEHHKEVTARLMLLQETLDTAVLDDYINDLRPEALNGRKALKAWERISVCMEQSVLKRKTCQAVNGKPARIKAAVSGWKQEMVRQANLTSGNVELVAAHFTGTEDRSGENSLAFAAWLLNKRLQDGQAGIAEDFHPEQLAMKRVPVVTRQLAASQNFFIDYYVDVLDTYGFIKPLAEGLKKRPHVAQSIQRRVKEEIYGTGTFSVATTAKRMSLPRLETGEILYRGAPSDKAHIVADHALGSPFYPMRYSSVVKLASAMNAYGRTSSLVTSNPDSFPSKGWYSVVQNIHRPEVCPRTTTWCSVPSNLYRNPYFVSQLARTGGMTRHVGVRPLDAEPGWNSDWYDNPYGVQGINFRTEFDHFITGPAVFDWDVRRMGRDSPYRTWDVGPGAWVKEHLGTANRKTLGKVPYLMGGPR